MSSPVLTETRTGTIATTDPGVAHDWLQAAFAAYRPEESNSHRDFRFRGRHTPLGRSSVSRLQYSLSADNNVELSDVLLVVRPSGGGMKVSLGRDEEAVPPGTPVLFPAHEAVSALWADIDAVCVSVPVDEVERIAVETTGVDTVAFRFTGLRPMTREHARRWYDTVRSVVQAVLRAPDVVSNPAIADRLTHLLAAAALDTFPSTTLATHRRIPPDHATPAVVRRAIDYIDAHADREPTLSEVADATGIGPRGLQAAFLRHRDTTPTAYAGRVRMDHAHQDLQTADPAGRGTVPAIAVRWGFPGTHDFADAYRRVYGRSPDQTLQD